MKNKGIFLPCLTLLLLFTCSFVPMPPPDVTSEGVGGAHLLFANRYGGEITKAEMAGHTSLKVEGCARGSRIFEYTLTITKKGKTTVLSNKSNVLTDEMVAQLNNLAKGDEFQFSKTKAYLPNGKDVVDVHSSKFVVVDKV